MLLVIAGHSQYVNIGFKVFLYAFHMPLFFFLSGMVVNFTKYSSFFKFLKSKLKSLIVPYFILGTIIIVFKNLLNIYFFKSMNSNLFFKYSIEEFKNLVIANRLHENYYGFWFILTLFMAVVLLYFIVKLFTNNKYKNFILIFIALITYFLQFLLFKYVKGFYWSLDLVPISLSFLIFGYLIRLNIDKIKSKVFVFNKYFYIFLIIVIVLSDINYHYYSMPDIFYCKVGNPVIFIITALLGIYIVLNISYRINNSKIIEYIGKNTFTYYLFHSTIVFSITDYIIWKISDITKIVLSNYIVFWVQLYITCILLFVISFVINKYLPFLYGRRRKI